MPKRISFARSGVAAIFAVAVVGFAACGPGLTGCRARSQPKVLQPPPAAQTLAARRSLTGIAVKNREPQEIGWLAIRLEDPPPDSLMAVKPENLPAHVRSLYRLRPDRRFLYAVAELERLTSGHPVQGVVGIRLEENRWRISLDGSPFGDLPEFPSFADAKSLLVSRLKSQPKLKSLSNLSNSDAL